MIKHLLVVFAALLTSLNVLAQEDVTFQAKTVEGVDMLFTVISETDKTCRIGDGQNVSIDKSTPGKVTIPQTANGYSVVEVGERAFRGCHDLTAIVIPEGIVTIAKNAFASCYGLLSLNIPASVSSIGERAFGVCYGLNSITVDKGNKNYDSRSDCNALIETATNTLIQGSNSTVIPNGVTAIGEQAFYKMQGIETVAFPEGLVTIGEEAYYGCENLVDVTLSSTVKIVGKESFKVTGLKSFTCSPAVVSIGEEAFYGCENLTEVEFSSSLSTLDTDAFENCPKLAKVTSHIKTPFAFDPHVFALRVDDQRMFTPATLYVPAGTKALYEATEGWKEFTKIVEMVDTPVDNEYTVNFVTEVDGNTNLNGNKVGNIYYCIGSNNGGFDATDGCIVVSKVTDDSVIDGKDIFSEEFKSGYTGIVFMVSPGKGVVNVLAETEGAMVLKAKVGTEAPVTLELNGKPSASFAYNVSENTNIYLYGGSKNVAGAKGLADAQQAADALKIYGVQIANDANGVKNVKSSTAADGQLYNLYGQKVSSNRKGILVSNGKKVLKK